MLIILPYLIIFLILFIFSIEINGKNFDMSINQKVISIFFCFLFCFFLGCRGCLDTDWNQYYHIYTTIDNMSFSSFLSSSNYEFGFGLFMYLSSKITDNYFFFQFLSFLIDFVLFYNFIINFDKRIFSLTLIFFFLFEGVTIEVDLLRNSKSIMIFLFSTRYCKENLLKYVLLNFIGFLFHFSSLIYLVITPFLFIKMNKIILFILFLFGLCVFIFRIKISSILLEIFLSKFTSGIIVEKALFYISSKKYSSEIGFSIGFIERFFSFILVMLFQDKMINKNSKVSIFINIFYLYFFVYLYCWDVYIFVLRFSKLFIVSYWVIFPTIYLCMNKESNKKLYLVILFFYAVLRIYSDYFDQKLWEYNTVFNLPNLEVQSIKVEEFGRRSNELFR